MSEGAVIMVSTPRDKGERFFHIVMAWQYFAGKPLKALDAGDVLTHTQLTCIEDSLRDIARVLKESDPEQWADLHKLATQIEEKISNG